MFTMRLPFLIAGLLVFSLGVVGIFLPLLPTTPLMLLAAFCFSRSSPALHQYLVEHPRFGPPLAAWENEGAISPRAKILATLLIFASFSYVMFALIEGWPLQTLLAIIGLSVLTFLWTRPAPSDTE